jgi:hypothetical protein
MRAIGLVFAATAVAWCAYAPQADAAHLPGSALFVQLGGDPGPDAKAAHGRPTAPLNTIQEVFHALEACWIPPDLDASRPGMQITVMLSFKRNGELLGEPRITYETHEASAAERMTYRLAVGQALARCTPLPFTEALGNALAGRPMTMRFIDNRKLKQAGIPNGRST